MEAGHGSVRSRNAVADEAVAGLPFEVNAHIEKRGVFESLGDVEGFESADIVVGD